MGAFIGILGGFCVIFAALVASAKTIDKYNKHKENG